MHTYVCRGVGPVPSFSRTDEELKVWDLMTPHLSCLTYCCNVVSPFTKSAKAGEVSASRRSLHPTSAPKFQLPASSAHATNPQRRHHRQVYHFSSKLLTELEDLAPIIMQIVITQTKLFRLKLFRAELIRSFVTFVFSNVNLTKRTRPYRRARK